MSADSETVLGEIPVVARLALGSEHLTIFPTTTRLIIAHVGKRGAGALAAVSFFGRFSGAVEDLFKTGREFRGKQKLRRLSPDEILARDKANFSIRREEIVRVELDEMPSLTSITILTGDEKFEFLSRSSLDMVEGLFDGLGSKLVSNRLPKA